MRKTRTRRTFWGAVVSSELIHGVYWDRVVISPDVIELRPTLRRGLTVHRSELEAVEFERQWIPPVWMKTVIRFRFDDGTYARKIFMGRTRGVRAALVEAGWPVEQVQFSAMEPRTVRTIRRAQR